jgi:predicted metalloprotease
MPDRERETIVTHGGGGGGGGGAIAAIVAVIAIVVIVLFVFGNGFFGTRDGPADVTLESPDVNIEAPEAPEAPDVTVDTPDTDDLQTGATD